MPFAHSWVCKAHMPLSDSSSPLFDSKAKQIVQDASGQGRAYIWHMIFRAFVSYSSIFSLRALYGCVFLGHYPLCNVAETEYEEEGDVYDSVHQQCSKSVFLSKDFYIFLFSPSKLG